MALACVAIACAKPPKLACETVFDSHKVTDDSSIERLIINNNDQSYYRSVQIENDKAMVEKLKALVEKDRQRAFNTVENYRKNGRSNVILNIKNNGCVINIGFNFDNKGSARLFVEGKPEAFK